MSTYHFSNRQDAGVQLARLLSQFASEKTIVLALPRGGVPVAAQVSLALHAHLDVVIVRKIGAPTNPELAIGAVAEDQTTWRNECLIEYLGLSDYDVEKVRAKELQRIQEQIRDFREGRPLPELSGKTALLIDDGLATGATMLTASKAVRKKGASRIIACVPIAASGSASELRMYGVEVIAVIESQHLFSVSSWYDDFEQVSDQEVIQCLRSQLAKPFSTSDNRPSRPI